MGRKGSGLLRALAMTRDGDGAALTGVRGDGQEWVWIASGAHNDGGWGRGCIGGDGGRRTGSGIEILRCSHLCS